MVSIEAQLFSKYAILYWHKLIDPNKLSTRGSAIAGYEHYCTGAPPLDTCALMRGGA